MKKNIKKKDIVILVALKKELPKGILNDFNIIYTGVGKVNAAFAIYDSYLKYKPSFIINYGTAGALNKKLKGLVKITSFYDRDSISNSKFIKINDEGYSCSTGENTVVVNNLKLNSDLVDMESYVYAKFSKKFRVKFECYKFISDYATKKSLKNWSKNLVIGAKLFEQKLFEICKIHNIC